MISSSGRRSSISIGVHPCSSEAVISDDGSRCPMRAVEQPHTSVHITRCDRSRVPFSTLDLVTAALIFSARFHPLPIVFQNRAGVLKKHCPSVENSLPVVLQFVGQRISVRRATNCRSFGNRIGHNNATRCVPTTVIRVPRAREHYIIYDRRGGEREDCSKKRFLFLEHFFRVETAPNDVRVLPGMTRHPILSRQ